MTALMIDAWILRPLPVSPLNLTLRIGLLFSANKFSQFGRDPLHSSLIPPQPSAPAVLRRDNSVRQKLPGSFSEVAIVSQYSFRIAGVLEFQHRPSIFELFLQPDESVCAELPLLRASSIPGV